MTPQFVAQRGRVGEPLYSVGPGVGVLGLREQAVDTVAEVFGRATAAAGENGSPATHRFEWNETPRLVPANGEQDRVTPGVGVHQFGSVGTSSKLDTLAHAEVGRETDQSPLLLDVPAPDYRQLGGFGKAGEAGDRCVDPLAPIDPSDVEKLPVPGPRRCGIREVRMYRGMNDSCVAQIESKPESVTTGEFAHERVAGGTSEVDLGRDPRQSFAAAREPATTRASELRQPRVRPLAVLQPFVVDESDRRDLPPPDALQHRQRQAAHRPPPDHVGTEPVELSPQGAVVVAGLRGAREHASGLETAVFEVPPEVAVDACVVRLIGIRSVPDGQHDNVVASGSEVLDRRPPDQFIAPVVVWWVAISHGQNAHRRQDRVRRVAETHLVSVVIASHGRALRLRWLLNALAEQSLGGDWEVVVVHDYDAKDADRIIGDHPLSAQGRLRSSAIEPGTGSPARQRNIGWRLARGELIAFIDDDCRPEPGWLESLVAGAKDPDLIVQGRTRPDPYESAILAAPHVRTMTIDPVGPYAQTCNILYPYRTLERLEGFDEVAVTGEDVDLSLRARADGASVVAAPKAIVNHAVESHSLPGIVRQNLKWRHLSYLVKRHPEFRTELTAGVFWDRQHLLTSLAITGLACSTADRRALLLAAPYLSSSLGRRGRSPRQRAVALVEVPGQFVRQAAEVAGMVSGALRHRTVVA